MRAAHLALLVAALAAVLAALAGPARADQMRAAERFAIAQSMEKRGDYAGAITAYREAYELSPHPSVLYNIAVNHERLEQFREAARYFLRYLSDAGSPDDADEVLARVAALREQPSRVTFEVRPPGAVLYIDGTARGAGSQTVMLEAGTHRVHVADGDRRSPPQQVVCEYGDEITVRLDLDARPGLLRVESNVKGAEVRVGGDVVGYTPYSGSVPAGEHLVLVSMEGYQPGQRQVTVPAQGSEQIRVELVRIGGEEPEGEDELSARGVLFGFSYGFDGQNGSRGLITAGYRPVDRFDLSIGYGSFGTELGSGATAEARFYFSTGNLRPYARAGIVLAGGDRDDRIVGFEGGGGLLWTGVKPPRRSAQASYAFHVEYFIEASLLYTGDADSTTGGLPGDPGAPRAGLTLSLPIVVGLLLRFG